MAHGEFKTPGGKLIAVDFQIVDNVLHDVAVTGDFFLYPEEALDDIVSALEGVPADLPEAEIAERVRLALTPGAELIGSSPAAIATALRRGINQAGGAPDER